MQLFNAAYQHATNFSNLNAFKHASGKARAYMGVKQLLKDLQRQSGSIGGNYYRTDRLEHTMQLIISSETWCAKDQAFITEVDEMKMVAEAQLETMPDY